MSSSYLANCKNGIFFLVVKRKQSNTVHTMSYDYINDKFEENISPQHKGMVFDIRNDVKTLEQLKMLSRIYYSGKLDKKFVNAYYKIKSKEFSGLDFNKKIFKKYNIPTEKDIEENLNNYEKSFNTERLIESGNKQIVLLIVNHYIDDEQLHFDYKILKHPNINKLNTITTYNNEYMLTQLLSPCGGYTRRELTDEDKLRLL